MKVDVIKTYSQILSNLSEQRLMPYTLIPCWDGIEIEESWLEPGWNIRNVLINPKNSPYLWRGYKGVEMRMSFYSLCFFAFYSGIMYGVIRNVNIISTWSYWDMHKRFGSNFILQSIVMDAAICNQRRGQMDLVRGDIDLEGIQMFSLVHWNIYNYFPHIGVSNFALFDEFGDAIQPEIENLDEVLYMFHRLGCACFAISLSEPEEDCRLAGKRIWGGPGMSQLFSYAF